MPRGSGANLLLCNIDRCSEAGRNQCLHCLLGGLGCQPLAPVINRLGGSLLEICGHLITQRVTFQRHWTEHCKTGSNIPQPSNANSFNSGNQPAGRSIPNKKQRKKSVKYDKRRQKRRNRSTVVFHGSKDWRRLSTRYDRCQKVFLSGIALGATVIKWL